MEWCVSAIMARLHAHPKLGFLRFVSSGGKECSACKLCSKQCAGISGIQSQSHCTLRVRERVLHFTLANFSYVHLPFTLYSHSYPESNMGYGTASLWCGLYPYTGKGNGEGRGITLYLWKFLYLIHLPFVIAGYGEDLVCMQNYI